MTGELSSRARRDRYGSKINRTHSPALAYAVPGVSILLGSLLPQLPIASAVPIVPPLGFDAAVMAARAPRLLRGGPGFRSGFRRPVQRSAIRQRHLLWSGPCWGWNFSRPSFPGALPPGLARDERYRGRLSVTAALFRRPGPGTMMLSRPAVASPSR